MTLSDTERHERANSLGDQERGTSAAELRAAIIVVVASAGCTIARRRQCSIDCRGANSLKAPWSDDQESETLHDDDRQRIPKPSQSDADRRRARLIALGRARLTGPPRKASSWHMISTRRKR